MADRLNVFLVLMLLFDHGKTLCYNLSFPANVKTKVTRSFQRDFKLVLKRTMFCDLSTFFPGLYYVHQV